MSDDARVHYRTCSLCEAMCGLELKVKAGRVISVRGDEDDPLSRGHICPKGPALVGLHEDPDRLRRPLRKTGSGWREVDWDEALDAAAGGLHAAQQAHGKHAVAVYLGNPSVHNHGTVLYGPALLRTLGTKHRYSATSVDQLPQMLAAFLMFGHQLLLPIPDIDRTQHMMMFGANPMVSNGSIMSAPDIKRRIRDLQARGGKLVVVDPRRTETAAIADEHVFVRPGTDAWLLLAMAHVLFAEERVSLGPLQSVARNLDALRAAAEGVTPERAAGPTGIEADEIRRLAREFAEADCAVIYARVGVSMHPFGALCHWLVNALNLITGNLDRAGGAMFPQPAFDLIAGARALGVGRGSFGRWKSRVRGLPEFGGELPVATLTEDMQPAGDEDPIRAMLTVAGNPVLSTPNGRALEEAMEGLDFMVSIDFYLNETTRHADVILPPTGPLEHPHYDVVFHQLAVRNTAKYSPALFEPGPQQRHDHQIIAGLERRLLARRGASLAARAGVRIRERLGPEGILQLGFRLGPQGFGAGVARGLSGVTLGKLRQAPHGIDLGPLQPSLRGRLPKRRGGEAPHIDLAPEAIASDVARLLATEADSVGDSLLLIGRRQLRSNNSWMHNVPKLMAGRARCTLQIHPDDAARLHIEDGQSVRISSRVGAVVAPAEVEAGVMPGVVSLPHGFGHHRPDVRLDVAREHAGVSINDITDEQRVDEISGVAAFSGVPVTVSPA